MENKPVTVEPVLCSDRQRDVSSNHAEIQVSRRRKAKDTVQFQTTENNHDQREESQNLHENNGQEIDAIGYSVQPENPDDLPDMLRDIIDTDGMINTCTLDTFTTIMAIQQYLSDEIHIFFTLSEHAIYWANSLLPDLLRKNCLSDMRRLIVDYSKCLPKISSAVIGDSLPKKSNQKNWAAEINDLIQIYVINEVFVFTHCDYCGHTRSVDVVNCMDLRPKDKNEGPNCLPDQMLENPFNFFEIKLEHYLNNFFLHNNGIYGRTETCLECTCESTVVNKVKDSVGCPAPVFFVMIPIRGSGKSGKVLLEEAVKDIPPLCCFNFEYVLGAIIMFKYNPGDHLGHYVAHIYCIDPGSKTKYYRYCNSKGINPVEDFEEEGDCVTFLFFRTK